MRTIGYMGRKKKTTDTPAQPPEVTDVNSTAERTTDRHKNKKVARLPDDIHAALSRVARRGKRPWTWELMRAVVAHLQAQDDLPPGYDDFLDSQEGN